MMRRRMIGAGFGLLGALGAPSLAPPALRGLGAILMVHHVRPWRPRPFAPNRLLEITPDFLDALLGHLRGRGYDLVDLDTAIARLDRGDARGPPFAALTFDDGYRDNLAYALPILERHAAPFTTFVTTGFADRSAGLWWLELEEAIRRAERVEVTLRTEAVRLATSTPREKQAAFDTVYRHVRQGSEDRLRDVVAGLCRASGVDGRALVDELCMDWGDVEHLSRHPLATMGAHTISHPRLAWLDVDAMRREIVGGRAILEGRIGRPVRHFAYPVGDPTSAGPREFAAAADAGFAAALTTRPGLVHPGHAPHPTALPRVSVNGHWQDLRHLDVLLSGIAFALWNRGRRVNVA